MEQIQYTCCFTYWSGFVPSFLPECQLVLIIFCSQTESHTDMALCQNVNAAFRTSSNFSPLSASCLLCHKDALGLFLSDCLLELQSPFREHQFRIIDVLMAPWLKADRHPLQALGKKRNLRSEPTKEHGQLAQNNVVYTGVLLVHTKKQQNCQFKWDWNFFFQEREKWQEADFLTSFSFWK